jgi:hypothetical protein
MLLSNLSTHVRGVTPSTAPSRGAKLLEFRGVICMRNGSVLQSQPDCATIARLEGLHPGATAEGSNGDESTRGDNWLRFGSWRRAITNDHYLGLPGSGIRRWIPVNLLTRSPVGKATRFSDAVEYTVDEIANDKLLAIPQKRISGTTQLSGSQIAYENSLHFRATQLLTFDALFSTEVLTNPGFVVKSNLGLNYHQVLPFLLIHLSPLPTGLAGSVRHRHWLHL